MGIGDDIWLLPYWLWLDDGIAGGIAFVGAQHDEGEMGDGDHLPLVMMG